MRRLLPLTLVLLAGCAMAPAPVVSWPEPPAPPVQPAPPTTPTPPQAPPQPPPPPEPAPADVEQLLARIVVGATLAEATAAVGRPPVVVPAGQGGAATARWSVEGWVVYAVLDASQRVQGKGAARVESNP